MALTIIPEAAADFSGAVLPVGQTMGQALVAIPGLIGAFDPADAPAVVSSWPARYGAGTLAQATGTRQPTRGDLAGRTAAIFNRLADGTATKALEVSGAWPAGSSVTIAAQVYFDAPAVDFQYLFGGAAAWRGLYRSSGYVRLDSTADADVTTGALSGWRIVIATQGATTTWLEVGGVVATAANAGAALTGTLALGNFSAAPTNNSLRGGFGKVVVAQSDLWGTADLETVRRWIAL